MWSQNCLLHYDNKVVMQYCNANIVPFSLFNLLQNPISGNANGVGDLNSVSTFVTVCVDLSMSTT